MTTARPRSRIHMLRVAIARLEACHSSDDRTIAGLKAAAKAEEKAQAEGRGWTKEDRQRTERQRTLFAQLPPYAACERLKEAMMQRAYDLLWDGDAAACDAILEFLPSKDAVALLDAWTADQMAGVDGPFSRWHTPEMIG